MVPSDAFISLPPTVRSPATVTFVPDRVIAVADEDWMSFPVTLISPANVVRELEVKVIFVFQSDA